MFYGPYMYYLISLRKKIVGSTHNSLIPVLQVIILRYSKFMSLGLEVCYGEDVAELQFEP